MAGVAIDLAKQKPKLTALPEGLDAAATSLDVSENALVALPPEIGKLTSLKTLNVSDNQLGELPEEIGSLREVEALLLYKNVLKRLPDAVGALHNLKTLNAFNNRMMTFPAALGAFSAEAGRATAPSQASPAPTHSVHRCSLPT